MPRLFQADMPPERDGIWMRNVILDQVHVKGLPLNVEESWDASKVEDGDTVILGQSGISRASTWRLDRHAAEEKLQHL